MMSIRRLQSQASRRCVLLRTTITVNASNNGLPQLPQQQPIEQPPFHTQRRSFSSNAESPKGPQLRRRFFKQVGITPVGPPWELRLQAQKDKETAAKNTIESPISAGVDGTQSASGVIGHLVNDDLTSADNKLEVQKLLRNRLIPRCTTITDLTDLDHHAPDQWYSVTLDGKMLRTPIGQVLSVPSEMLAWAIAAEWDAQTAHLLPTQMPLMTLTCTALDQVAAHPEHYQQTALQYLPTDTTCYWADPTEDRLLHRRQETAWKDLHGFIEDKFEEKPAVAMGTQEGVLFSRRSKATGKIGLPHPETLYDACVAWTQGLDAWHLTALNSVAAETKSFLVAYAVLHPESPYSHATENEDRLAHAIRAARVEEEFQIESWGLVEGQHDYDRLNCSIQVRSAKVLAKLVLQN